MLKTRQRECGQISSAMIEVLRACAEADDRMPVSSLVRRSTRSINGARASLSRTLRRLWRRGIVELENDYGYTLTRQIEAIETTLAKQEQDPENVYRKARAQGGFFPFADATEYLESCRVGTQSRKRHRRIQWVRLTNKGREALCRLTSNDLKLTGHRLTPRT